MGGIRLMMDLKGIIWMKLSHFDLQISYIGLASATALSTCLLLAYLVA